MRSDKAWAFRASNTDLVELDNPSSTLEDPSPIESAMRFSVLGAVYTELSASLVLLTLWMERAGGISGNGDEVVR